MKSMFLLAAVMLIGSICYCQPKTGTAKKIGVLTTEGAELVLAASGDGRYTISYHNSMGGSNDTSKIVFKNKKDASEFINKIGNAFAAKDGTSFYVVYSNYKIRLLTEMSVVFMIVNETGKTQSTFRITKENYTQLKVL